MGTVAMEPDMTDIFDQLKLITVALILKVEEDNLILPPWTSLSFKLYKAVYSCFTHHFDK